MAPSLLASSNDDVALTATAVAIDKDRNSQYAVRWAVEKLLKPKDSVFLVHVKTQSTIQRVENSKIPVLTPEHEMQQFFLPYRGFCGRKGIRTREIVLHDIDITNALVDFIHEYSISNMVLGASGRSVLTRAFRNTNVPTGLSKVVPGFCSIHVVSKSRAQNLRSASQPCTPTRPLSSVDTSRSEENYRRMSMGSASSECSSIVSCDKRSDYTSSIPRSSPQHPMSSPNRRFRVRENLSNQHYVVNMSDFSGPTSFQSTEFSDKNASPISDGSRGTPSPISPNIESEMMRLRLELKKTMEMYSSANREATTAMDKANEIKKWKTKEGLKLQAAKKAHETALAKAKMEKQKTKAAVEAAQMAQRIAELEVKKRKNAEKKVLFEAEEKRRVMDALARTEIHYRKYNIEDIENATHQFAESMKIGEGGYGPVYKAFLDHTSVAIKVLRTDIAQGKSQFEKEVKVLSYIRHPNMVLLLGACPEYGCLVYEYMENGTLKDRIFRKNNTPPMTWQTRFRIATEIATSLLFLHQTKPEPLVHRDLKPSNILLDRNYVSKISDVGLSRLVPASVADGVTRYHLTAAAGSLCFIDPEYQQTGMLCVKSDIYSFGILLLQLITAKPVVGLTHYVERAISKGTLMEMLDPTVPDWPLEEANCFAKLALKCCELKRKDRPDLGTVVLPELKRICSFGFDDVDEIATPRKYVASLQNTGYHCRPPFSEEPRRKSYCGVQTEIEKSSLSNEGTSETNMNLGCEVLNNVLGRP